MKFILLLPREIKAATRPKKPENYSQEAQKPYPTKPANTPQISPKRIRASAHMAKKPPDKSATGQPDITIHSRPKLPDPFSKAELKEKTGGQKKANFSRDGQGQPAQALLSKSRRPTTHWSRTWALTPAQRAQHLDMWVSLGADAAALAIIQHRAPDILEGLLQGAAIPGGFGSADRQIVLRFLGLGHLTRSAPSQVETDRRIDALGDRLAAKLAARRTEIGHKSATPPRVFDADVLVDSGFSGVTHKMNDLVREAEASPEADPAATDALADLDWS